MVDIIPCPCSLSVDEQKLVRVQQHHAKLSQPLLGNETLAKGQFLGSRLPGEGQGVSSVHLSRGSIRRFALEARREPFRAVFHELVVQQGERLQRRARYRPS